MRLINTESLHLREFYDDAVPDYAILSHFWEDEEVSYQDYTTGVACSRKGYRKILKFCELARELDLEWAWVDTCCIDKTSSAELSEAINSMYQWYERSYICFVFLSDYRARIPEGKAARFDHEDHEEPSYIDRDSATSATHSSGADDNFGRSRWFTRGWTLQELLAPKDVLFFDQGWSLFGTKKSLCGDLTSSTGVGCEYLQKKMLLSEASVAHRMSWASSRRTTRVEDVAYSLLGVFDVNMPLLYGEGPKAFIRLQENIMQRSNYFSLFAWHSQADSDHGRGLLARHPQEFADSASIRIVRSASDAGPAKFTLTNLGIELRLPATFRMWFRRLWIINERDTEPRDTFTITLPCANGIGVGKTVQCVQVRLWRPAWCRGSQPYYRIKHAQLEWTAAQTTFWHSLLGQCLTEGGQPPVVASDVAFGVSERDHIEQSLVDETVASETSLRTAYVFLRLLSGALTFFIFPRIPLRINSVMMWLVLSEAFWNTDAKGLVLVFILSMVTAN